MTVAIIGGTGLSQLPGFVLQEELAIESPFGALSHPIKKGVYAGKPVMFLPRHGHPHKLPPHKINYRANIDALRLAGATEVLAINAVGGIHAEMGPAQIAVPDQVIDYTYGREHTFYDGSGDQLEHIDFTYPYSELVRTRMLSAAGNAGVACLAGGVYAATQGPRLETAAEVTRIARDGGDIVGMTGMPEAALAREAGLEYACLALSVNWCAGMTEDLITMEDIERALTDGMTKIEAVLSAYLAHV